MWPGSGREHACRVEVIWLVWVRMLWARESIPESGAGEETAAIVPTVSSYGECRGGK